MKSFRQTVFGFLDSPAAGQTVNDLMHVQGWVLGERLAPSGLEFRIDGTAVPACFCHMERPDVARAYPALASTNPEPGFVAAVSTQGYADGEHTVACVARVGEEVRVIGQARICMRKADESTFYQRAYTNNDTARRRRKLELLLPILACPRCRSSVAMFSRTQIACIACHQTFPLMHDVPVMVSTDTEYPVDASLLKSPPSNNPYPSTVLEVLEQVHAQDGLALDVGSGRRLFGADRLVQLEICAYPFTDVVSQAEGLPFRDESFDFVFSLAVTEHVKRPWILASEMQRVLRRGGTVIVDSAFLQPLHGYPSHYFNMTHWALRDLFEEVDILSLKPRDHQHPWFALRWILDWVLSDLAPAQRSLLGRLTVERFLEQLSKYCQGQTNQLADVRLSEERLQALAAGFTLHGRRRPPLLPGDVQSTNTG
ncbi:MAG: methyltransferase domain-containing protein [Planctomycetes bacterium]|nr:methyltransferase domain-containing protein [Planctomycetota bacterium]